MTHRLALVLAGCLAATSALAQGQPAPPAATEAVTPRPAAMRLEWPVPPPEIAARYPVINDPSLLRYPDGRVALSVPRRNTGAKREADELYAVWLVELDDAGAALTHRLVPFSAAEFPANVLPMRDGGVFISSWRPGMLRVDRDGNRLPYPWLQGAVFGSNGHAAAEMADGAILLAGASDQDDRRRTRNVVARLDRRGREIWHRTFGPLSETTWLGHVTPLSDAGAIVAGGWKFYRLDSAGRIVWRRELPGLYEVVSSRDDSVIGAGQWAADSHDRGPARLRIVRLDRNGRELWRRDPLIVDPRAYAGSFHRMFPTPDGGALLYLELSYSGRLAERPRCRDDDEWVWDEHVLARIDAAGTLRWVRNVAADPDDPCADGIISRTLIDAAMLPGGNILVLGTDSGPYPRYKDGQLWLRAMPFD